MKTAVESLVRYHAALEARDFDAIGNMLACDVRYVSAGIGSIEGRDALIKALRSYFENHSDHRATDEHVEAHSERSAISKWRLRATDNRTGVAIERQGTEVATFDDDELIAKVEVFDQH